MAQNPMILLVNSDEKISTVLSFNLERCGFVVNRTKNGNDSLIETDKLSPHIVIIDDNIDNQESGQLTAVEVCTILKTKNSTKNIPVFVLTTNVEKFKALRGIASGVEEVISKPFPLSELVSKAKNICSQVKPGNISKALEYKDLKLNPGTFRVTRNGRQIHLGPTEFKILQCLMELPSKTLSREHIMRHVWGFNSQVEPRTIDVHINRLRAALRNDNEKEITLIKTVRSAGYSLSAN